MRLLLATFLITCGIARATTFSTDASDLWYNASESGWGVNVIHQNDTLFATLFVYGSSSAPAWYVASAAVYTGTQGGALLYSGPLYQTSGPYFGGSFNPAAVGVRQVGTVTFRFDTVTTGTITYTVDGVSVTKAITRQTWKRNELAGSYIGAAIGTYTGGGCGSFGGYREEPAIITVTQTTTTLSLAAAYTAGGSCSYSGAYTQTGRMGTFSGALACSSGSTGTVNAFEIQANISGFTARASASLGGGTCTWSGRLGGLRRGS